MRRSPTTSPGRGFETSWWSIRGRWSTPAGRASTLPAWCSTPTPAATLALLADALDRPLSLAAHARGADAWLEVGGIELATTPERLAECHRRQAYAGGGRSGGVGAVAGRGRRPGAAGRPRRDPRRPLHLPRRSVQGRQRLPPLQADAESRGAEINGLTEVVGFDIRDGRVRGVETSAGSIATTTVIACAGIWSKSLQAMTGVPMPLQPMQHLLAYTVPVAELAGTEVECQHPILRHQDRSMYFRQRGDAYGIGAYRHEPLTIEPHEFAREADGHTTAQLEFTEEHFADARDATNTVLPPLRDIDLADRINGHFSFTPDGYPMLGESSRVRGPVAGRGHLGNARRRIGQGRGRPAHHRPQRDRSAPGPPRSLSPVRDHGLVRQGARRAAVPRGVRHHPPAAAAAASPRTAHHALPSAFRRGRRRADRKRRLGARPVVRVECLVARPRALTDPLGVGCAALVARPSAASTRRPARVWACST